MKAVLALENKVIPAVVGLKKLNAKSAYALCKGVGYRC